jgi:hypothetical protein
MVNDAGMSITIRDDLAAAQRRAWERLARPGAWWTGAERVAIAAEARHALTCRLCAKRKAALSPHAVAGEHDHLGALPGAAVEIIHRVRTDAGRLTLAWFDGVSADVTPERYVELVGVVVTTVVIDTFALALGEAQWRLPEPQPGAPLHYRPRHARRDGAWVPWLAHTDADPAEADLFPPQRPGSHIYRAMSLVPDEVRGFFDLVKTHYLQAHQMRDFAHELRAITHAQIEFLAARVSALNRCEY